MRVILVPVADRPECVVALDAAFGLATEHSGNVIGCHVRPHRPEEPASLGAFMPEGAHDWPNASTGTHLNSDAACALFNRIADRHGFSVAKRPRLGQHSLALWHEMVGTPARILSIVGPVADLAVISRPKAKSSGRAAAFLLATLLHSTRPVLVLPQRRVAHIGKRILIAWNQSAEAAATVIAAVPMLQRAEQVTFVSCGAENRTGPKSAYIRDYLIHWGIKTDKISTKGDDVEREIEQTYREVGADLLLMGAYSRPRLRELVFGGVTERMLFKTNIPVLMSHG